MLLAELCKRSLCRSKHEVVVCFMHRLQSWQLARLALLVHARPSVRSRIGQVPRCVCMQDVMQVCKFAVQFLAPSQWKVAKMCRLLASSCLSVPRLHINGSENNSRDVRNI